MYDNFARTPVEAVQAGDICALTGLAGVSIGETICDPSDVRPLPTIEVRLGWVWVLLRGGLCARRAVWVRRGRCTGCATTCLTILLSRRRCRCRWRSRPCA